MKVDTKIVLELIPYNLMKTSQFLPSQPHTATFPIHSENPKDLNHHYPSPNLPCNPSNLLNSLKQPTIRI